MIFCEFCEFCEGFVKICELTSILVKTALIGHVIADLNVKIE